ncbi:MAG TPA: NAD(P)H-hydrate dehydratase [Burkholderiales bacterium]
MKPDRPVPITLAVLRRMPLPPLSHDDDKESRGRVLVIGGSRLVPGAILLAGVAALRAGAGKLQLATVEEAAPSLGIAVPEALALGLPTRRNGEIEAAGAGRSLGPYASGADGVLLGPGMGGNVSAAFIAKIASHISGHATLVLDGTAICALRNHHDLLKPLHGRAILTPHAGEMAKLLDIQRTEVEQNPPEVARRAARRYGATVVLKGPESWIADADENLFRFRGGSVGLGTSGSGDVLAGIVAGLAARGAAPLCAGAWAVWAHGQSGQRLARKFATVGFLARELLDGIPALVGKT